MKLYFKHLTERRLGEKIVQSQQLVRVDNIKEFLPLLFDSKITDFFLSQKFLIARGEQTKPVSFKHIVSKEVFELLISKLHQKIGFKNLFNISKIEITTGSEKDPCIVIGSEV